VPQLLCEQLLAERPDIKRKKKREKELQVSGPKMAVSPCAFDCVHAWLAPKNDPLTLP
jgi:hypothetical protein